MCMKMRAYRAVKHFVAPCIKCSGNPRKGPTKVAVPRNGGYKTGRVYLITSCRKLHVTETCLWYPPVSLVTVCTAATTASIKQVFKTTKLSVSIFTNAQKLWKERVPYASRLQLIHARQGPCIRAMLGSL